MLGGEYNPDLLDEYCNVERELMALPQEIKKKASSA